MSPGEPTGASVPSTDAGPASTSTSRPLPVVARDLAQDVQDLISQEIALAKAEVTEVVVGVAKATAMFVTAGVLGLYLLDFVFETIARALEGPLPDWAAWLVVTLLILVIMVVLALVGKGFLPKESPGTAAKEELDRTKVVVQERIAAVRADLTAGEGDRG